MVLSFSPLWIRFYNLPFGYRSNDKIKTIAKTIGEVMEIEEDFLDINPYVGIRVWLDITKILKWSQLIGTKGSSTVKITVKCERLPRFCFLCGIISHIEKDCSNFVEEDKESGHHREGDTTNTKKKSMLLKWKYVFFFQNRNKYLLLDWLCKDMIMCLIKLKGMGSHRIRGLVCWCLYLKKKFR